MAIRVSNVTAQGLITPTTIERSLSDTLNFTEEAFTREIRVANLTVQILQLETPPPEPPSAGLIPKGCMSMDGFFRCFAPRDPRNVGQFIPFTQEVSIAGSEWARSVESVISFEQSDYFIESLNNAISFADSAIGVRDLFESVSDSISFSQSVTIAGGVQFPPDSSPQAAIFDSTASVGMAVYASSSGHVDLGQGDVVGTSRIVGVVSRAASAGGTGDYQTEGQITQSDWTAVTGSTTLTVGAYYYLSETTAGQLTTTAPSTPGESVVAVGRALTTTTLDIEIAQAIEL